jgi:hypothetical protein
MTSAKGVIAIAVVVAIVVAGLSLDCVFALVGCPIKGNISRFRFIV